MTGRFRKLLPLLPFMVGLGCGKANFNGDTSQASAAAALPSPSPTPAPSSPTANPTQTRISGRVLDSQTLQPIGGAVIRATDLAQNSYMATSAGDGTYSFSLPNSTYLIWTSASNYIDQTSFGDTGGTSTALKFDNGVDRHMEFRLLPVASYTQSCNAFAGISIQGAVTTPTGSGIAGAKIVARNVNDTAGHLGMVSINGSVANGVTTSATDGSYLVGGLSGNLCVYYLWAALNDTSFLATMFIRGGNPVVESLAISP